MIIEMINIYLHKRTIGNIETLYIEGQAIKEKVKKQVSSMMFRCLNLHQMS